VSVYLIAELGSTHDGSLGNCLKLIELCAQAGVDAVKLQDHRGERLKGDPPWFKGHEPRAAYLQRTSFDENGWRRIRATATACGADLVVSPFSVEAVQRLAALPVDGFKIASGQVTNLAMLREIRATRIRSFMSTGMTTDAENEAAWVALGGDAGDRNVTALHCTSEYPCPPERVGLNYCVEGSGFSDHTMGFAATLAAVDRGCTVIERHVTFHRGMYGTDAAHSLTIGELRHLVREVRDLERMLASPVDKEELAKTEKMRAMREAFLEPS
jgi:N-acetylneuraminate synthase